MEYLSYGYLNCTLESCYRSGISLYKKGPLLSDCYLLMSCVFTQVKLTLNFFDCVQIKTLFRGIKEEYESWKRTRYCLCLFCLLDHCHN